MAAPSPNTTTTTTRPHVETAAQPVPQQGEGLEYKLALAFGFMSVIPIMIVWAWAKIHEMDMSLPIYAIVASVLIGYFLISRRIVKSVVMIAEKVKALSSGQSTEQIDVTEHNEIGELARSFNRITRQLEHKITELETSRDQVKRLLSRIGAAINSRAGIEDLLNLTIENTTTALGADMGSLMLVDGEKQELTLETTWSTTPVEADRRKRIKLGEGIAGWVAREGHSMRGTANQTALGFVSNGQDHEGTVLCIPLKLRDQAMGVVTVLRHNGKVFVDDDEVILTSIGSQMATAIENSRLNLDVERTYMETIMALALAVEAKDPYSAGHSKRVGFYASQLAKEMGMDTEVQQTLHNAGILHDIGKIGVKDEILLKPGRLTDEEFKLMQQHPVIGEAIVKPVRALSKVVQLVRCHHERYDGKGYPSGLKGEEIPLEARLLSVVDAYDAMSTNRPYRKRLTQDEVKAELKRNSGIQHDPQFVEAFLRMLEKKELHQAAAKTSGTPA